MRKFEQILLFFLLVTMLWSGVAGPVKAQQGDADGIPDGYMLIEGDILVPIDFYQSDGIGIQSAFGDTAFWPNGLVHFVFDANVSQTNRNLILNAMTQWENVANVDFTPRNSEADFVRIRDSSSDTNPSNSSAVGRQGGEQIINIVSWNSTFIMAHELAHALGFWHEQSRPDRNNYVQINNSNIQPGLAHNFDIRSAADVYPLRAYGLPDDQTYDFDSVMHYSQFAFSNNGQPTITVPPPNQVWQNLIGQRTHLSRLDQLTMSFLYPENNWRFVDQTYVGSSDGTFLKPDRNFIFGYFFAPTSSILWIQPGNYLAKGTYSKPITLQAPLGNVVLGQQ